MSSQFQIDTKVSIFFSFSINLFIYLIFGFGGSSFFRRAFSNYDEQGLVFRVVARASHCHGISCWRARALGA